MINRLFYFLLSSQNLLCIVTQLFLVYLLSILIKRHLLSLKRAMPFTRSGNTTIISPQLPQQNQQQRYHQQQKQQQNKTKKKNDEIFNGLVCFKKKRTKKRKKQPLWPKYVISTHFNHTLWITTKLCLFITVKITLLSNVFSFRKIRLEAEIRNMLWKIRWEDLNFPDSHGHDVSSFSSRTSVSMVWIIFVVQIGKRKRMQNKTKKQTKTKSKHNKKE